MVFVISVFFVANSYSGVFGFGGRPAALQLSRVVVLAESPATIGRFEFDPPRLL
jgi:hypothetical protein